MRRSRSRQLAAATERRLSVQPFCPSRWRMLLHPSLETEYVEIRSDSLAGWKATEGELRRHYDRVLSSADRRPELGGDGLGDGCKELYKDLLCMSAVSTPEAQSGD